MKRCFFLPLVLCWIHLHGQPPLPNPPNSDTAYVLPVPTGWHTERFPLPTGFAPQISYTGVEDIRFAPGWAKARSEEYWTYAFLWYLDGEVKTNTARLQQNLGDYYTGLFHANTDSSKRAGLQVIPARASLHKTTTATGDRETYTGTLDMMDYLQRKPLRLYVKVHIKPCGAGKTAVFFQLSPKSYSHANWRVLNRLWAGFSCTGNR